MQLRSPSAEFQYRTDYVRCHASIVLPGAGSRRRARCYYARHEQAELPRARAVAGRARTDPPRGAGLRRDRRHRRRDARADRKPMARLGLEAATTQTELIAKVASTFTIRGWDRPAAARPLLASLLARGGDREHGGNWQD